MTQKANPIVIGIFVVSALLIALTALMVFGASKFFTKTEKFVCYFKSGINGLDIGAPVKYKGVEIGKVEDILIFPSPRDPRKSMIATKLSIDLAKTKRNSFGNFYESESQLEKQIEDGLRAKLNFQSIVTGMLYIELDYFEEPNTPFRMFNIMPENIMEIPVVESNISDSIKLMEKTLKEVSEIDFNALSKNINALLETSNEKIAQIDVAKINSNLVGALENINAITEKANKENLPAEIKTAIANAKTFFKGSDNNIKKLASNAEETMANINRLAENANALISPNSPFLYDISIFLQNISQTAYSLKTLADFLDRNPSALLTGRPENE